MRTSAVLLLVPGLAVALALAGCTGAAPPASVPSATPAATSAPTAAFGPVWRVRAEGAPRDTWIRLGTLGATVWRPEGHADFSLATDGTAIATALSSWNGRLGAAADATWLTGADRIAADGAGFALLGDGGAVTARLVRDGTVPGYDYHPEDDAGRPSPAPVVATPGPGTAGTTLAALLGTWHVAGRPDATVRFAARSWSTHPTCDSGSGANGVGGGMQLLPEGRILLSAGASTAIGCGPPPSPLPEGARALAEMDHVRSVRVAGDRLTVFDVDGTALGTLERGT